MNDLVDTTEMYLRTIYDLEEEGVVPLRARIAERLEQSGPTVSQTVSRMERDGLLHVAGDRHLELTDKGRALAISVMRKHRLAERLLVDVIGLPWEEVHAEACRWEHVMSEDVERRLVQVLNNPTTSPFGNPIPGLSELGVGDDLELHAVGVAEEQRPLVAQALDLTDLGAGIDHARLDLLEHALRFDRQRVMIDRAAVALLATLADDLVGGHFEDVERRPAAEVEDRHLRVVALRLHLERHHRLERVTVELHRAIHVGCQRGDVVETFGDRHVATPLLQYEPRRPRR